MKPQTKTASLFETCTGVIIGFGVALLTQIVVFPLFNLDTTFEDNIQIASIFTVVSVIRGYLIRRLFNWLQPKEQRQCKQQLK